MYSVKANFESETDAHAMVELLQEMGYVCSVTRVVVNKGAASHNQESPMVKVVLDNMGDNTHYQDLGRALKEAGYSSYSIGGIMTFLVREGLAMRLGGGRYRKSA